MQNSCNKDIYVLLMYVWYARVCIVVYLPLSMIKLMKSMGDLLYILIQDQKFLQIQAEIY